MSRGRTLGRDLAAILAVATISFAAVTAFAVVEIIRQGNRDEARPADAIVVLGAAQYNGVPSAVFESRLEHAVALYQQGIAKVFVVTGGKLPGDNFTEAQTARAYALEHGVPASAIVGEDTGRDTLQSLENVGALLRSRGLTTVVFVSDRTHMLRVLRMATDQGLRAWGSPTPDSPTDLDPWRQAQAIGHELAGLIAYVLGGGQWISDPALLSD
ncbi:MAG TPA: YdcF family protein [Candidatus Limnocylindrales bacterium]|jgi:uncharacterized SAM-binding protein YcdF (DUF218 family)